METLQILKCVCIGLIGILSTALAAILLYGFAAIVRVLYYEFKNIINR